MTADQLEPGEQIHSLQRDGLRIIQKETGFRFGIDAVLLSDFVKIKRGERAVEFGTGTGIVSILLTAKTECAHIDAFEIQRDMADMASRSVTLNGLTSKITIIADTLCAAQDYVQAGEVDVVFSNPPYMARGAAIANPSADKAIARHEISCTLEDVVVQAQQLLRPGGRFYLVHRPHRLPDIMALCRTQGLEPKRLRTVHPQLGAPPNILLLQCVKGGGPELVWEPPLAVYAADGGYSKEVYAIYDGAGVHVFSQNGGGHV